MDVLYPSTATLKYSIHNDVGHKLVAVLDNPDIAAYYRSLIPKYVCLNGQRYGPHISVIRYQTPPNIEHWGKYEGEKIDFQYSNIIHHGQVYYWLNAFSKRLEEIRVELGLSISDEYTRPPDTFEKVFHITLGNLKNL